MKQITLVPLVLCSVFALGAHGAQTWYVAAGAAPSGDGSSAHPFATIQAARVVSLPGDLILVGPGSYLEDVEPGPGRILRSIQGAEVTVIRSVLAIGGLVEGFTIQRGAALWSNSSLKRCVLDSNFVPGVDGVFAEGGAIIEHCVFTNCWKAIQVFVMSWEGVQVTHSIFFDNHSTWDASWITATHCCVPSGVILSASSSENIVGDPLFFDAAQGDYHLTAGSPCIPFDIGVYPFEAAYPTYATEFCLGDGSVAACPCSNESASTDRAGCRNSTGAGATLRASGRASLSHPSAVLRGEFMPGPVLYFQGTSLASAFPFGNGVKCTGGALIRLGIRFNVDGASTFPGQSQSLSIAGLVDAPGVRMYQARYRDIMNSCSGENFNYTNGVSIDWHY